MVSGRGFSPASLWLAILWLGLLSFGRAGYLNVQMNAANQCGRSLVQWSGDDGPYHLLLTPTEIEAHGYNVWLPSLPNGTNSYNLSINQPAGLQFILTMWGASGIAYAGTTDILTVGPPANNKTDCFWTDEEILGLYSFSFNISDTYDGYPPQCSNLTMSWPTSLESNVTGSNNTNNSSSTASDTALEARASPNADDQSSSSSRGNTTYPPTMFGVIPLGNSFNIPITYDRDSNFSQYLPESSLSDDPTTWTMKGVTYLNWTVPLAKGTRFILVAGIGSEQKWASGGSSALLTVGQGSTDCVFSNGGDPTPSVTATTGTYTGGQPTDTSTTTTGSGDGNSNATVGRGTNPLIKTVLACVFSVLATLLLVGICIFCRRTHKRRKAAAKEAYTPYISGTGSRNSNRNTFDDPFDPDGTDQDTPLELIDSRIDSRIVPPILTDFGARDRPPVVFGLGSGDTRRLMDGMTPPHSADRSYATMSSPPTSPTPLRHEMLEDTGRQSSLDHLLSPSSGTFNPPAGTGTYNTTSAGTVSTHRPLMLHDRTLGLPYDQEEEEDMPDLKRETLAMAEPTASGSGIRRPQGGQRRRRGDDLEYVVHRDAGRVRNASEDRRRVLELPPRYEELNWEDTEGGEQSVDNEAARRDTTDSPVPR